MRTSTTKAEIANLIAQAEAAGFGHVTELLRPAMRGTLNVVAPARHTRMPPLHRIGKLGLPVVALIGDDDYAPAGPAGWACAAKLRTWARYAVVHGAAADARTYAMAAAVATIHRRVLFIETTSDAAPTWATFLRESAPDLPLLGILPGEGAHPIPLNRGALH